MDVGLEEAALGKAGGVDGAGTRSSALSVDLSGATSTSFAEGKIFFKMVFADSFEKSKNHPEKLK